MFVYIKPKNVFIGIFSCYTYKCNLKNARDEINFKEILQSFFLCKTL